MIAGKGETEAGGITISEVDIAQLGWTGARDHREDENKQDSEAVGSHVVNLAKY
jgi:hypothetical protein